MHRDRKPNWNKWRHVPDVTVWEAAALSLGIEPLTVQISPHSWMVEQLVFHESEELKTRIFVAGRNLMTDGALTAKTIVAGDPASCIVSLPRFAAWALSLPWEVPPEFADLARAAEKKAPNASGAREQLLEGKARTSALKLILGMALGGYGYDPTSTRSRCVTRRSVGHVGSYALYS